MAIYGASKLPTPTEYTERAVSLDHGRYNLNATYREEDRLIGCDGHRLHLVRNLPKVEKPHFSNGQDAEFPNYRTVMLKEEDRFLMAELVFSRKQLTQLKALVKLCPDRNCGVTVTLNRKAQSLTISQVDPTSTDMREVQLVWTYTHHSTGHHYIGADITFGMNLRYIVEALIPDMHLSLHGKDATAPFELTSLPHPDSGIVYHAVIMPLRLD